MKYLMIAFFMLMTACGGTIKIKGDTEHTVNGEVKTTNEFVFRIDVSGCDKLEGANQAACITQTIKALGDLVTMVKQFACKDDTCKNPIAIPVGAPQ
jgi:hypothetical protein